MLKLLLSIISFLFALNSSMAQESNWHIGINSGLQFSEAYLYDKNSLFNTKQRFRGVNENLKYAPSSFIGIQFSRNVHSKSFISLGLNFENRASNVHQSEISMATGWMQDGDLILISNRRIISAGAEYDLQLLSKGKWKYFIGAGPLLSYVLNFKDRFKLNGEHIDDKDLFPSDGDYNIKQNLNYFELGITLNNGISYSLNNKCQVHFFAFLKHPLLSWENAQRKVIFRSLGARLSFNYAL